MTLKCSCCLLVALLLGACSGDTQGQAEQPPVAIVGAPVPSGEVNSGTAGDRGANGESTAMERALQPQVDLAVAELSGRMQIPAADVAVVGAESVTWTDGAMGCPEPGMMYTQALVPGYRIRLQANGRTYYYHGRKGGAPMYCAKPASGGRAGIAHPDA